MILILIAIIYQTNLSKYNPGNVALVWNLAKQSSKITHWISKHRQGSVSCGIRAFVVILCTEGRVGRGDDPVVSGDRCWMAEVCVLVFVDVLRLLVEITTNNLGHAGPRTGCRYTQRSILASYTCVCVCVCLCVCVYIYIYIYILHTHIHTYMRSRFTLYQISSK